MSNGMQSKFVKYNYKNQFANQVYTPQRITIDPAHNWLWSYSYSYSGAREQKRLLYSPHGDSLAKNQDSIYAHLWEYSLLGAGGEELALYKGKQRSDITATANGRRVYMSLSRFYCGGELQIRADGKKELHITDNLGCVRMVLVEGETTHLKYNFTPFGEPMNSDSKTQRKGFMMATYDNESNLTMMGARMYDRFSGMFTSPDPLLDYFPTQSTYSYAMNNPLRMKDPSGLAPEGEKYNESLQREFLITDIPPMYEIYDNALAIMQFYAKLVNEIAEINRENGKSAYGGGGGISIIYFNFKTGDYITGISRTGKHGNGDNGQKKVTIDPKTKGAWDVTKTWDDEMIKKYREFAGKQAEMYKESGKKFTCEDLALQVLIDFAAQNNLPLSITNESGTFKPENYSSFNDFKDAVLSSTGARDLQNSENTIRISLDNLQKGDLLIQANDNKGIGHHVQIISNIGTGFIYIIQGDVGFPYKRFNNPSDSYYIGGNITSGIFNIINGSYINIDSGWKGGVNYLGNFQIKSWNFNQFNR